MKLCSFIVNDKSGYGIVTDAGVVDLGRRFPQMETLRDFLTLGTLSQAAKFTSESADYGLDDIQFAPVIPNPDKIVCVGLNYHDHIKETGNEETVFPVLFARYAGSQIGHNTPLIKPLESDMFDYEGELAVIIGKEGRRVSEDDALNYVAGYSCYNDGSIRDYQKHTKQFMPGKTFFGTGGFGPWMVTSDEITDPSKLTLETRLNGKVVQNTSLELMISSVPRLISYISTILPILPGDVIVSGTPGGVGARRTPPLWMRDGDVCEVEISGIGTLSNSVINET